MLPKNNMPSGCDRNASHGLPEEFHPGMLAVFADVVMLLLDGLLLRKTGHLLCQLPAVLTGCDPMRVVPPCKGLLKRMVQCPVYLIAFVKDLTKVV